MKNAKSREHFHAYAFVLVLYDPRFCSLGITFLSGNWFNEREEVKRIFFIASGSPARYKTRDAGTTGEQCRVHTRLGPLLRLFLTT